MTNETEYMRDYMHKYRMERKLVDKRIGRVCANCGELFDVAGHGLGKTKYCQDCKILSMDKKLNKDLIGIMGKN